MSEYTGTGNAMAAQRELSRRSGPKYDGYRRLASAVISGGIYDYNLLHSGRRRTSIWQSEKRTPKKEGLRRMLTMPTVWHNYLDVDPADVESILDAIDRGDEDLQARLAHVKKWNRDG